MCKSFEKEDDSAAGLDHAQIMAENMAPRILVVDDDVELGVLLSDYLGTEGFQTECLLNGEEAVAAVAMRHYDAVILDIMLPRMSGTEVLRRIRAESQIPVIMLTAKGDDIDRVIGLELGADDYVPKPYFPRELVARLRAVLRRQVAAPAAALPTSFDLGGLHVDVSARRVRHGVRLLDLTLSEFKLLLALLQFGDNVASKEDLSLKVLGRPRAEYDRSVDVHVSNLRQKLVAAQAADIVIETVRGVGYRLRHAS